MCSVLISNIFVYPCCKKKPQPPKPEDGQKYIEYVLGITSADIILSFSFDVQLEKNGMPKECESYPPYKSIGDLLIEYGNHFKNNDDLEGCMSYWLMKPIKKNKYLTFSCSVYFIKKGKGNVNSSQSLEKCSGDVVDFFADISFYKLIEFKYSKLENNDYSLFSSVLPNIKNFRILVATYNAAVDIPGYEKGSTYIDAKKNLEDNIKDRIYKCK